jgi:hypothetical protein
MSEYYEHNPGDHEDPVSGATWLLGVVGAVLLLVILLGLTALYYNAYSREFETKYVEPREPWDLRRYRSEQRDRLHREPRWESRIVAEEEVASLVIPIGRAMELVVQEGPGARTGGQTGGAP